MSIERIFKITASFLVWISLMSSNTFSGINERQWLDCYSGRISAEKTRFDHYGIEIYRSLSREFLFIVSKEQGRADYCIDIGREWGINWELDGFKTIQAGKDAEERVLSFHVRKGLVSRYFNVDNGKEIFVGKAEDGQLYVDYEQDVSGDPFKYP